MWNGRSIWSVLLLQGKEKEYEYGNVPAAVYGLSKRGGPLCVSGICPFYSAGYPDCLECFDEGKVYEVSKGRKKYGREALLHLGMLSGDRSRRRDKDHGSAAKGYGMGNMLFYGNEN